MTRVFVHIDRLVLTGVGPAERQALAGALRAELTRRLAAPEAVGRLTSIGNVARLRVDGVVADGAAGKRDAKSTGAAVARGIDRALGAWRADTER